MIKQSCGQDQEGPNNFPPPVSSPCQMQLPWRPSHRQEEGWSHRRPLAEHPEGWHGDYDKRHKGGEITLNTMTAAPFPQFSTSCMKPSETSSTVRMPNFFSSMLLFVSLKKSFKIAVSAKAGQMHWTWKKKLKSNVKGVPNLDSCFLEGLVASQGSSHTDNCMLWGKITVKIFLPARYNSWRKGFLRQNSSEDPFSSVVQSLQKRQSSSEDISPAKEDLIPSNNCVDKVS